MVILVLPRVYVTIMNVNQSDNSNIQNKAVHHIVNILLPVLYNVYTGSDSIKTGETSATVSRSEQYRLL